MTRMHVVKMEKSTSVAPLPTTSARANRSARCPIGSVVTEARSIAGASGASKLVGLVIAALFLPITALGSLLGMNLVHGFETWHAPYAFWAVAAAAFLLGILVRASLSKPPAPRSPRIRKNSNEYS